MTAPVAGRPDYTGRHRAPEAPHLNLDMLAHAVGDIRAKSTALNLLKRVAAGETVRFDPADAVHVVELIANLFELLGEVSLRYDDALAVAR